MAVCVSIRPSVWQCLRPCVGHQSITQEGSICASVCPSIHALIYKMLTPANPQCCTQQLHTEPLHRTAAQNRCTEPLHRTAAQKCCTDPLHRPAAQHCCAELLHRIAERTFTSWQVNASPAPTLTSPPCQARSPPSPPHLSLAAGPLTSSPPSLPLARSTRGARPGSRAAPPPSVAAPRQSSTFRTPSSSTTSCATTSGRGGVVSVQQRAPRQPRRPRALLPKEPSS
eukprot:366560-Chlamydomonas_euryale.AAC.13